MFDRKAYMKQWWIDHPNYKSEFRARPSQAGKVAAYSKLYRKKNAIKVAESKKAWYKAHPGERAKEARRWMAKYPNKLAVHRIFSRLRKADLLKFHPCKHCGAEKAEVHHANYNQPFRVTWLCHPCHMRVHHKC